MCSNLTINTLEVPQFTSIVFTVKFDKIQSTNTVFLYISSRRNICQKTGFLWPVFFHIRAESTLQTHHVYSTLKRRGSGRFHVVSTWNTRGMFVGYNSVYVWEKTGQRTSVFWNTLRCVLLWRTSMIQGLLITMTNCRQNIYSDNIFLKL